MRNFITNILYKVGPLPGMNGLISYNPLGFNPIYIRVIPPCYGMFLRPPTVGDFEISRPFLGESTKIYRASKTADVMDSPSRLKWFV